MAANDVGITFRLMATYKPREAATASAIRFAIFCGLGLGTIKSKVELFNLNVRRVEARSRLEWSAIFHLTEAIPGREC